MNSNDIITAIQIELKETPNYITVKVQNRIQDGAIWILEVESLSRNQVIDESYEGCTAWWANPTTGTADVLSVIPDIQLITLRFATEQPPDKDGLINIYTPKYLENLLDIWNEEHWSDYCLKWFNLDNNKFNNNFTVNYANFPQLRARQKQAFQLIGWDKSFLWGPPGTGKTFTIGTILAQFVVQFPQAKVLLLSTTNSAVDIALVSVDKSLEEISKSIPISNDTRKACFRIGNHFIAQNYKNREHLLPIKDLTLVKQLTELEARRPDKENIQEYALWKEMIDDIRRKMREQIKEILNKGRIVAMTTTRAAFSFEEIRYRDYDLIIFDEASQVSIAYALGISPIAKRVLFAGDPYQLSSIIQSEDLLVKQWLGRSMFEYKRDSANWVCMLNEQSRMAKPICDIVSKVFYNGDLVVAKDKENDQQWLNERSIKNVKFIGEQSVCLLEIKENGKWSAKFHGPVRFQSAELICELVRELLLDLNEKDILILTPFRAQRIIIKQKLKKAGYKKVSVSTVHRAQGGERHTIIFDPACGNSNFLNEEKNPDATRLINVALSRAKARLVILLSGGDKENSLLQKILFVIENKDKTTEAISINNFINSLNFPDNMVGEIISIDNIIGKVARIKENKEKIELIDINNGQPRTFITEVLIQRFKT